MYKLRKYFFVLGYGLFGISAIAVVASAAITFEQYEVGVLSIIIALQFLLSQFSGVGIHFSTLYYNSNDSDSVSPRYGLLNVLICSTAVALLFSIVFPDICRLLYPVETLKFVAHLAVYAVLASTNKVFIAQLNAKQRFDTMGLVFAIKGLASIVFVSTSLLYPCNIELFVFGAILLPEIITVTIFLLYAFTNAAPFSWKVALSLFKRDTTYGIKAFWGALFLESSTKVDILILGAYTDARITGIYTFIALVSDLFLQYTTLIRNYFNPSITKVFMRNDLSVFKDFVSKKIRLSYLLGIPFLILLCFGFSLVVRGISDYATYTEGLPTMYILVAFFCVCAGYFPVRQLFGQIGQPMKQSVTYFILFSSNLLLNMILIPRYGMNGAALATGLSYVIYSVVFQLMLKHIPIASKN